MTDAFTLALIPIARPTFDVALAQEKTVAVRQQLTAQGFTLIGPQDLVMTADDVVTAVDSIKKATVDVVMLLQASFADSTMALLQIAKDLALPLLLWALPEKHTGDRLRLNSFCGINLAAHGLTRAGQYRLVVSSGEMIKAPPAFTGTSGIIRFDSGAQAVMNTILQEGLEHHISLTYGDHIDALRALARMLDLPVLRL